MLDFLQIENIAVAKKLEIYFKEGFNVLTGETGAGKSIIVDSINMLLGAKVSRDMIRYGESKATVTAYFSNISNNIYALCDEYGVEYDRDDVFTVSRSFTIDGKNTVKINSHPATLQHLKLIVTNLINIHGQNENQAFMNKANHISLLDEYVNLEELSPEYNQLYSKLNQKKAEIAELIKQNKETSMMSDVLAFQIKEISLAKLKDLDEEEKLVSLRKRLKDAEKIVKSSNTVYKALLKNDSGVSAVVLIEKAMEALSKLSDTIPEADDLHKKLKEFRFEIEDIAEKSAEFCSIDGIDNPEEQLECIESRLALIQRLEKKYAPTIKELIEFKENAEEKLKSLESGEYRLEELKKEYKHLYSEALEIAQKMHELRSNGSIKLGKKVKDALTFLDMPKVQFEISVKKLERDGNPVLTQSGFDDVEFLIATNAGEELLSMNKVASGGELSRIMLALKSALSDKKGAQTVVFDEIDVGVSGSTSQKIGIKLAKISKSTQTLCVTHSAQIAALANNHFYISKSVIDERAYTQVRLLNDTERIDEIARIISGIDLTKTQYDAALELINQSRNILNNDI